MERVLVSGVEGFTGRYLAPLLSKFGYEVHGVVQRLPDRAVDGVSKMHVADLTDATMLRDAIRNASPHRVVHLAGISYVASDAEMMYRVNLLGTRNMLEALCSLPAAPFAVLLASSANVYGNAAEGMLDETSPPAPANDYAVSKLAMEYLAKLYSAKLPLIICRPFNYTGVGQSETFLLPKIVAHAKQGASEIELGNLDVARDFSDVREVAATYAALIGHLGAIGQTLNLCSGRAYTLRDVLAMTAEICGREMAVKINPAYVRHNDVKILLGNRNRLDKLLQTSSQTISLHETLRWMLADGK